MSDVLFHAVLKKRASVSSFEEQTPLSNMLAFYYSVITLRGE